MAVKTFTVIYNRTKIQSHIPEQAVQLLSKAQAESKHSKLGKEPVTVTGPVEDARLISITAETAEAAAVAARLLLGASASEGEFSVVESAVVESKNNR